MNVFYSILIGYLIGGLSPASLLGRRKHVDLSENGTGNLGATNTLVVLGWRPLAVWWSITGSGSCLWYCSPLWG